MLSRRATAPRPSHRGAHRSKSVRRRVARRAEAGVLDDEYSTGSRRDRRRTAGRLSIRGSPRARRRALRAGETGAFVAPPALAVVAHPTTRMPSSRRRDPARSASLCGAMWRVPRDDEYARLDSLGGPCRSQRARRHREVRQARERGVEPAVGKTARMDARAGPDLNRLLGVLGQRKSSAASRGAPSSSDGALARVTARDQARLRASCRSDDLEAVARRRERPGRADRRGARCFSSSRRVARGGRA